MLGPDDPAARTRGWPKRPWPATIGLLLLGALALRLWGIDTGLPYVYNADENAHFVPRAIGMFGHSYNPEYFINPPGFTYVLHAVFALRWGGDGVQTAFAADVGDVFVVARIAAAVLGTAAVGLLYLAGARLFGRPAGIVAAGLLATSYLAAFYSHFALNDVPALAPLCLALVGVAGVLRTGRALDFALAGIGLGLATATKYTSGIVLLCLVAAAVGSPGRRVAGLALAGALALVAFLAANPYALLDFEAFTDGLADQSSASNDGGGKLGLTQDDGLAYYLESLTWGLGWLPLAAALGGGVGLAASRDRRAALVLVPPVVVFLLFMGAQDRFFARWVLPVVPLLCLLAGWGVAAVAGRLPRPVFAAAVLGLVVGAQGLVTSVHSAGVLAREDTRQLVRDWMVANVPARSKVVVEPVFPDAWASDPGAPRSRWNKWPTSRSRVENDGTLRPGPGRVVKLEDYERTTRPALVSAYARGGYCWVVTGSTQYGRAYAEPETVPQALRYYAELRRRGTVAFRASPYDDGSEPVPFSFDSSFNYRPFAYRRPGPEIVVYRLRDGACAASASPGR